MTIPGIALRAGGIHTAAPVATLVSGIAILGASFLLLWACDAAQEDVSQALALSVVALVAVLPEYSVDMYFTWCAGVQQDHRYAHYAIANMTGANRLLIGVAWGLIAALYWLRTRKPVLIERERRTEVLFLGGVTLYAFIIAIKGTLAWYDGLVLIGAYVWYIVLAARRGATECDVAGPAELLTRLPKTSRRLATAGLFVFAAGVILVNAEPFSEGLLITGRLLGVGQFVLVQWLAPIASETPEFVVALVFAWRGQPGLALGSLLSAKLNQWTLLVGMIPGAFAAAHRSLAHPIPMESGQMSEILLTAAQSLLGVVLIAGLRLSIGGAALLFVLFASQLFLPAWHPVFSALYIGAAAAVMASRLFRRRARGGPSGIEAEPVMSGTGAQGR